MEQPNNNIITGLTEQEAQERLKRYGYNELPFQKKRNVFAIFFGVVREPMLLLLIGCGMIYFFLGEATDALMLVSFVFVVVGITFYQERKTERTLEALRDLSSPRALVIRQGQQRRVAGREVVMEDVIILKEGDRIPADAMVISCSNLCVDESLLTGESLAVRKSAWDGQDDRSEPGGDDLPFVFSGTLVVQGTGMAKVTATGSATRMGKIGRTLTEIKQEDSLLQKEMARLVRNFSLLGVVLCSLVVIVFSLTRGSWLKGLLSGLTLSMAMLPEEFPVVLIIFLTLGAWRISKNHVLTRHAAAIEALGAASVLCTDKTGTITLNSMSLTTLCLKGKIYELDRNARQLPEKMHGLIEYAILAGQQDPYDPVEKEVKRLGESYLSGSEHIHKNWKLIREYPLSKELLALSQVWESPDKTHYVIAAKGSPEAIAELCHFNPSQHEELVKDIEAMAAKGLRVLGVARASFKRTSLPSVQHDFVFEFMGLLGFIDPIRPAVPAAIREAYEAGMRVIMITGDYPRTAMQIAGQIGLKDPDQCITGQEIEKLEPQELIERFRKVNVFARVIPEQKLAIVNALKADSSVVAMTGDGVNDAPALKAAHIGIAMGERGTDVAREASDLVLLNDDFSSIVQAVRVGRRIFDNLKKASAYILAVHVPIAGMSLLPILFKLPLVLLPAHIAFLELIVDPACSTVFEASPEEKNIMNRPPRKLGEHLLDRKILLLSLLQGLSVLAVVFTVFLLALNLKKSELEARTLAFSTLIFANIMLIMTNLSWSTNLGGIARAKNAALFWVVSGALAALGLVIYVPQLRQLFHFSLLHLNDLFIAMVSASASLIWFEILKLLNKKFRNKSLS